MKKFCIRKSLKMAFIMGFFQGGMTLLGWALGSKFSSYISDFDHWIAFILLVYLGGKMIYESFRDESSSLSSLSTRTLLTLGIATSIDALAVGISFAFLKVEIVSAAVMIGATTFILSAIGVLIGKKFGFKYKNKATVAGGLILILIGTKILLEHLGII